jgi:hypothetical protein
VKATAAAGAPAFDIWAIKQSAKLGGCGALSHALWAVAKKLDGMCHTEAAVMRPAPAPGGMVALGFWAKPNVETRRATAKRTGFIFPDPLP